VGGGIGDDVCAVTAGSTARLSRLGFEYAFFMQYPPESGSQPPENSTPENLHHLR
jgi:hypothetical protein